MIYWEILALFLTAAAASPNLKSIPAYQIQDVLQEMLAPKAMQPHVRNEHDHNSHHSHEDRTNIETLNLIFKNNRIIPDSSLKPIGRTDGDESSRLVSSRDIMSQSGVRCGCSGKSGRCGCGRSGAPSSSDHDHKLDNKIILKAYADYIKPETDTNRNVNLNKKSLPDPIIIKLLDDLENTLLQESGGNQNSNLGVNVVRCEGNRCDDNDRSNDVKNLLKELERSIDDPENVDETNVSYLRCCRNCGRKSYYRSSDDDKAFLRCCKKCGNNNKYYRTVDKYFDRNSKDKSDSSLIKRAKSFQITDNLDAIVLDVADVDNLQKLLNNGNNFDNSNSVRDYARAVNAKLDNPNEIKYQKRFLLPKTPQMLTLKDLFRRSDQSDAAQYGVPFELDVQGLGQVNS